MVVHPPVERATGADRITLALALAFISVTTSLVHRTADFGIRGSYVAVTDRPARSNGGGDGTRMARFDKRLAGICWLLVDHPAASIRSTVAQRDGSRDRSCIY